MKSWIVSNFSHAFLLWPFRIWGNFLFHYPYLIFSLVFLVLRVFSSWPLYICKLYQSLLKVTQRSPAIFSEFPNTAYSSLVFCLVLTLPSALYSLYLLCMLFSSYKWRTSVSHFRADHGSQNELVCCVLPWQWMHNSDLRPTALMLGRGGMRSSATRVFVSREREQLGI